MHPSYFRNDLNNYTESNKIQQKSYISPQTYISNSTKSTNSKFNNQNLNLTPMVFKSQHQMSHASKLMPNPTSSLKSNPINSHRLSQCKSNSLVRPTSSLNINHHHHHHQSLSSYPNSTRSHSNYQTACSLSRCQNQASLPPAFSESCNFNEIEQSYSINDNRQDNFTLKQEDIAISAQNLIKTIQSSRSGKLTEIQDNLALVKNDHEHLIEKVNSLDEGLKTHSDQIQQSLQIIMVQLKQLNGDYKVLKDQINKQKVDAQTQTENHFRRKSTTSTKRYSRKRKLNNSIENSKMESKSNLKQVADCFEEFGRYLRTKHKITNKRNSVERKISITVISESGSIGNRNSVKLIKQKSIKVYSRRSKETNCNINTNISKVVYNRPKKAFIGRMKKKLK